MKIGIVGGGINGVCAAWQLAISGHNVVVYEKGTLLGETSSASSKLLHGGIRYLENYEFSLVKEALKERAWWLKHVPQYTKPLELFLPIYQGTKRSSWIIRCGLFLYDLLAGSSNIEKHTSLKRKMFATRCYPLKQEGLKKVFSFFDGQMDESKLGQWVVAQARDAGVIFFEHKSVNYVDKEGWLHIDSSKVQFDCIINLAGPWASELCEKSKVKGKYELDLIRGSHLILNKNLKQGYLLESPEDERLFFVLPYKGKVLVGTTEVRQQLSDKVLCSKKERNYLLAAYNHYFIDQAKDADIAEIFSGLRPLVRSKQEPSKITREYAIEKQGRLIIVYGGKWTTARSLAKKIVKEVNYGFH